MPGSDGSTRADGGGDSDRLGIRDSRFYGFYDDVLEDGGKKADNVRMSMQRRPTYF